MHSTAAIIDPGFEGTITLELYNLGNFPIPLYPGVRIAQIIIYKCEEKALRAYKDKGSAKYSYSIGAKRSMFFEDDEYTTIRNKINNGGSNER